jgi:hypothetical protein
MKITAALCAVAAVAFAPLASAQIICNTAGNAAILGNLTSTSTIKRTTVTGGHRIVQSVTIKNTGAATATGLSFSSNYDSDETFIKGNAKIFGSAKPVITANATQVTSSVFSIPVGKTLKATLVYKAKNCPTLAQPRPLGNLVVTIPADSLTSTTCRATKAATNVQINKRKTCP